MALTVTATTPGATHTSVAASATLVAQLGQTFAVGDYLVVGLAMDNAGSGGAANAFTSASFTGFDGAFEQSGGLFDNGAAAAGVEYHFIAGTCTSARVATDTITFNFSPNVTAKCVLIWKITGATGESPITVSAAPVGAAGSTTGTPTITTGATVPIGRVTIGFIAVESNAVVTADADVTNGAWSAQVTQVANTGTLLTSIRAAGQSKTQITAASTQTYNPTLTSADQIIAIATFAGNGTARPAAIAITGGLLVPAPTASGGSNTTPAAIALAAVVPAPTVVTATNGTATPTAIALTVTTPAPTASGNSSTTPAAVARSVVTPAPTASGSSNTTPAAVALLAVTPAPTVTGGSSITPAAVAITGGLLVPAPTTRGSSNTTPAAVALSAVTPAATAASIAIALPAAVARSVVTPAPFPAAWPISDTFTGTNGDPWYAGRWDPGAGQPPTIVGNRGDFTSTTGTTDLEYAALKPALLAGQGGRLDIRVDIFIVDTASLAVIEFGLTAGTGYLLFVATDGSIIVMSGLLDGDIAGTPITLAANDTLHNHIVRDSATGYLSWTWWINAATEPATPNIVTRDASVSDIDYFHLGRIQDDVNSVRFDTLTIVAPKAFPADIVIGPDVGSLLVPDPTARGGSNITPAAIARLAVTPAPTTRGSSNATPAAIALSAVTSAPTASGSSSATPAAVALSAVTSAPTASGGSSTTPAAVARSVVTPAPTITGTATTTPTAIALAAVVYDTVGFPVVSTASSASGNGALAIAPLTASAVAGDLVLVIVGSTTLVAPAGYTKLFEQAGATSFTIWGRIADGTAADAFYSNTANQAAYLMWRITHHGVVTLASDIHVSSGATTATNVFDPPSLDAGSSDQWLWIAAAYYATSSGGLFFNTAPTGYSGVLRGNSGGSGIASNIIWAWKQAASQTEDPATMTATTASANINSGVAVTLAIKPASHATVSGSANTTPAAVARSAVTPAPTITGTASTTPATIALTVVVSAPTASAAASTTPTAITLSAVTEQPTTTGDARAPPERPDVVATLPDPDVTGGTEGIARPNPFPIGARVSEGTTHTFTDDFTGVDGDPLDPAKWESDGIAQTVDIQSNRAHIEIASAGYADVFTVALAPRLFFDLYAEITIADIDGGDDGGNVGYLAVTACPDNVGGFYMEPATGFISTGSGALTDTLAVADGDTIKVRVIRGESTTETYVWISGPQPVSPLFTEGPGHYRPNHQPDFFFDSAASTPWVFDLDNVSFTYWDPLVVVTGDANVFPTAVALAATTSAPTASGGSTTTPAAIALAAVTPAPTASGTSDAVDGTATPTAITLAATTTAPTATGSAATTPAAVALTAVTPPPTASGSSSTSPTTVVLAATTPPAASTGNATANPATVARPVVTPPPTASGATTTTPAAITLAATLSAPTVTGTARALPAAVARTVVTPAPTVTGSSAGQALPAAITVAATTPAPTARGAANTSPAAITLAATVPPATETGGAQATPPTIARSVTVPPPAASGTAVAFPATIALAATTPPATATTITDVTPATITLAATVPAPTASGTVSGTATPPAVVLAVTVPAPVATGVVLQPYWGAIVG